MTAQPDAGQRFTGSAEDFRDLSRDADADGIGERDLVGPRLGDPSRDSDDPLDGHLAFEGAAERGADRDGRAQPCRIGLARDLKPRSDGFIGADALVTTVEGVACDHRHADLVATGSSGTLVATAIEHQADEVDALAPTKTAEHRFRIRHLGDLLRIYEARDFDPAQTCIEQSFDELDLGGRREHPGFAL